MKIGVLYTVATPIGNLGDMSMRAIEVLKQVDFIAAEDTRHSKPLLQYFGIDTPLISLHEHNENERAVEIIQKIKQGKNIALISDAGTPLISDPGSRLLFAVREENIQVVPIPGACAVMTALMASSLDVSQFIFIGFLPAKGSLREKALRELIDESRTLVFYESVHRIKNLLELLLRDFGSNRRMCLARELTKKFESIKEGSIQELHDWFLANPDKCKGEFVVLVEGNKQVISVDEAEQRRVLEILLKELPVKQASSLAADIMGASKNELYQLALTCRKNHSN